MLRFLILLIVLFGTRISFSQNSFYDAFSFETMVTGDFIYNFSGGIKTGYTYIGMEDFAINFDTEAAKMWKNGNLFIHALNAHGIGPSTKLTGDLQILSNIEAGDYTGLYELWYSHSFCNFTFLIGQHDLNSEFVGTKYGGTFINSSFGIAPNISLNVPVSVYPVAAPCILVKYEKEDKYSIKLASYDGDPGNFENNRFNLQWNLNSHEGFLNIGEFEYFIHSKDLNIGSVKLGAYYHTGNFTNYTDTLLNKKGNFGLYLISDYNIFPKSINAGRGLCFFFQGGLAPPDVNMVQYYVGAGFRYHGILPNRFKDELGIALAHIQLSEPYKKLSTDYLPCETALECTYIFSFGTRYSIQPSVQYIINPGANTAYSNSFTGLLRFTLTY